jgi:hypothetical protein
VLSEQLKSVTLDNGFGLETEIAAARQRKDEAKYAILHAAARARMAAARTNGDYRSHETALGGIPKGAGEVRRLRSITADPAGSGAPRYFLSSPGSLSFGPGEPPLHVSAVVFEPSF